MTRFAIIAALWIGHQLPSPALAEGGGAGGGENGPAAAASRESAKRQEQIRAAQELFTDAELDRRDGNHASAVEKYRTAFLATPDIPAAAAMRESIYKRYQLGAIAYAEQLIGEAKWADAEGALVQLMNDGRDAGIPAGQIDPTAKTLLARLRGDFYNQAMTPQHLENVSQVENLLIEANGFFEIGDFTKARRSYDAVLNIDPYNTAARRGIEKTDQIISEYAEVARNQTRSTMLRQVAQEWETPVPPSLRGGGFQAEVATVAGVREAELKTKLNQMVLPQVEFVSTPLQTVVEYLIQMSQDLDVGELDPSKKGINIVIDPRSVTNSAEVLQRPVTLRLTNAPLETVLKYATDQAGMKYRIDAYAVSIIPLSASDDKRLMTRTYQVPPDFISGQADGGGAGGPVDPFAAAPAGGAAGGTLVKRISAQEFLEGNGVTFPEGSLASFNPTTSSLVIKNTPDNISLVEQLILAAKVGGSKLVKIEFKLIETTERNLNELGMDWLVGQSNAPGGNDVFTSGGTLGNGITKDFPFITPAGTPLGQNPVTGGLRSGVNNKSTLTIDDVINRDSATPAGPDSAPGVLSVAGAFTDPTFQAVLRALSQKKGTDLLCTAAVVTRPGERAIIKEVREFIYPTEYDEPQLPSTPGANTLVVAPSPLVVAPANPAAFETRELGKILEVEPVVGADNITVDINLITDLSEFAGFINYGSPINIVTTNLGTSTVLSENRILMPVFEAIKESTNVTIYDGQTLVIGGLLGESVNLIEDKVPLLGDTPVLGPLFRSNVEDRTKRAIVLFASVRILDPSGNPANDLSQLSASGGGAQ